MEIPDRLGLQVGYRKWRVQFDATAMVPFQLRPMSPLAEKRSWTSRTNLAQCSLHQHKGDPKNGDESVPVWSCSCGYHAFYDYETVAPITSPAMYISVAGITLNWGKLVHHETFFRAQYAAPVALYIPASKYREFMLIRQYIPDYIVELDNEGDLVTYGEEIKAWNTLPRHLDTTRQQSDEAW